MAPAGGEADVVVDARDVHFSVGDHRIFAGLSLSARRGRITAVMGPSGTGKTTLLRLITGEGLPDSGRIEVWGRDVAQLKSRELYAMRTRIGMLFQNGALLT
ncbi:MAG: ATP-binding cassette domain-containing protein, partial [Steroidobacteraceae bacterium]